MKTYVAYLGIVILLTVFNFVKLWVPRVNLSPRYDLFIAITLSVILIFIIGLRNPFDPEFCDSARYASRYLSIEALGPASPRYDVPSQSTEMLWNAILRLFALGRLGVAAWFTLIAAIWVGSNLFIAARFFYGKVLLGLNFALLNFCFFSCATNGIRNGEAFGFLLVAIALLTQAKNYKLSVTNSKFLIALLCMAAGILTHHSVALPAACLLLSIYIIKRPVNALIIWLVSIIISLTVGLYISEFITTIPFPQPNRLSYYMILGQDTELMRSKFAYVGFRWDFVIFSFVPMVWGLWNFYFRNCDDRTYSILLSTYILSNAVWLLLIHAAYTNRIAMLSWFLQWLVVCYPLLRTTQKRETSGLESRSDGKSVTPGVYTPEDDQRLPTTFALLGMLAITIIL